MNRERKKLIDPIDIQLGKLLRLARNACGLSQGQLGALNELTFQQIQKYERGINRMGSSRLFQIARTLSVPVAYFFEEIPAHVATQTQAGFAESGQAPLDAAGGEQQGSDYDIMHRRETLELIRAYYRIQDAKQRRKVYELIRSMSDEA